MSGTDVTTGKGFQPGHKQLAPHKQLLTRDLIIRLNEPLDPDDPKGITKKQKINDQLVTKACSGDMEAIKFVYERAEGKTPQVITGEFEHRTYDLSKLTVAQLQQLETLVREVAIIDITPDQEGEQDAST